MNPVNGSGMKRAALLNDLSCFGKCSLTVAAPVVSAWGVEAVPLPTAVLSAQTAFPGYIMRDFTREMEEFSAQWETLGLEFDCIYTGFFANGAQIDFARRFIERFAKDDTLILVDPVLGDNGALYGCFGPEQVEKMRQLCRMAHVITPNRTEAALLAGLPADTPAEELLAALRARLEDYRRRDEARKALAELAGQKKEAAARQKTALQRRQALTEALVATFLSSA